MLWCDLALAQAADHADSTTPYGMPMDDDPIRVHALLEQFEYRNRNGRESLRWDGQAWIGTDSDRLWLKSEGELSDGSAEEGQHQILYGRPISRYFDLQAGLRYDLDSMPGRGWAALGVQGLAPYFFEVSAMAYASSSGHIAASFEASFDLLLTQRLILQPQIELDFYTKNDPARQVGSGLSELDAGLRLRYEISRKFAPYVGLVYERSYGATRNYKIAEGEDPSALGVTIGLHAWL